MEKPMKHYVAEVRGADGLERTLYLTATSASELRQRIVARGYKVVSIRLDRRPREETEREEAQPTVHPASVVRLARVVLSEAASQGARTISVDLAPRGVKVSYLVGEEWREVMVVPRQVWPPLRRHFAELAGLRPEEEAGQAGELAFTHRGEGRTARIAISAERARIELADEHSC